MSKLIVTQKLREVLHVGDDVKITVYRIKGSYIRMLIEAPPHIRILRDAVKKRQDARHD